MSLNVLLRCKSLAATREFYRDTLGFEVNTSRGNTVTATLAGSSLIFTESDLWKNSSSGSFTVYFAVADIGRYFETVKGRLEVAWPLQEMPYGSREFGVQDCNGYLIAFQARPADAMRGLNQPLVLEHASLVGSSFSDANLEGAGFQDANLRMSRFCDVNLSGANFTNVKLSSAGFTDVNLSGANFTNVKLSSAGFTDVNLSGANFTDVNLSDAKFADAKLSGAHFTDIDFSNASIVNSSMNGLTINGVLVSELFRAYEA